MQYLPDELICTDYNECIKADNEEINIEESNYEGVYKEDSIIEEINKLIDAAKEVKLDKMDEISDKLQSFEFTSEQLKTVDEIILSIAQIDCEKVVKYSNELIIHMEK